MLDNKRENLERETRLELATPTLATSAYPVKVTSLLPFRTFDAHQESTRYSNMRPGVVPHEDN